MLKNAILFFFFFYNIGPRDAAPSRNVRWKSVKTTTENPRETRTRENSNLILPAGDDGPAGSKPFRRERWILPGEEGGSPTDKPTIVQARRKAGLANQYNPRGG